MTDLDARYHWLHNQASTVADMGRRVVEVLDRQPNDTMYAGNKMTVALEAAAQALVFAGRGDLDELLKIVREAHTEASEALERAESS
jgi:hypothetical protein